MKFIIPLIIILFNVASAQSVGNTGLSFLKLGFGARNVALGETGSVMSNDVTSLFYNPARLNPESKSEVILMHNSWVQGIRSEVIGVKFNFLGLPWGFGLNSTSIDDIEIRRKPGEPEGTFNSHFVFGTLATGYSISEELSLGASIKLIYENIWIDDANGIAFDLAANYQFNQSLSFSASLRNLGKMNKLRNESTQLPSEFRIGSSFKEKLPINDFDFAIGIEAQKYFQVDEIHLLIGSEFVYNNILALRVGYQTLYDAKNISTGVGIIWNGLSFDYALTPMHYDLGMGHTFSIKLSF
ncbi:MAG: PorV/PorQ family protein [Ignavibacteriaceae bacterium]|nr:PorV/PorQ family protein [Ignavibacteriaceae bacterium]